jgi:hypothetical protein
MYSTYLQNPFVQTPQTDRPRVYHQIGITPSKPPLWAVTATGHQPEFAKTGHRWLWLGGGRLIQTKRFPYDCSKCQHW